MPEKHLVIQLVVNPSLDNALDIAEVGHHVPTVERVGANLDFRDGIVPVRMLADAVVIEEAMSVAEIDALGDRIHVHNLSQLPRSTVGRWEWHV